MGTIFGGFIDLVILMATVISGLLEKAVTFLLWLVKLDLTKNSVSKTGETLLKKKKNPEKTGVWWLIRGSNPGHRD